MELVHLIVRVTTAALLTLHHSLMRTSTVSQGQIALKAITFFTMIHCGMACSVTIVRDRVAPTVTCHGSTRHYPREPTITLN